MSVFLFWNIQWDGREQKVGFAEQQLRLRHTGLNRVRRPVGGLLFWVDRCYRPNRPNRPNRLNRFNLLDGMWGSWWGWGWGCESDEPWRGSVPGNSVRYTPIDTHPYSHARATTPYSPLFPNRLSLFLTNPLFVNFPSRQSKHSSVEPALFWMSYGKKRNKIKYVGIKFGNNTKLFYLCGNFSLIVEGCKKP